MFARTELFLVPLSALGGELRVLVRRDSATDKQVLPHAVLKQNHVQRENQESILRDILSASPQNELDSWLGSPRCKDRIVDCFDRDLLFENSQITRGMRS